MANCGFFITSTFRLAQTRWQVILPSSVPYLVDGLRLGTGRGIVGVIIAELYVSREGIGFLIRQSSLNFQMATLIFGVVLVAVFGIVLFIFFGISFTSIIILVVLFTIFPIIVNTALGVRLVDPVQIRSAVSFGASRREVLQKVVLPAALPSIAAGLQLAIGRCFAGAVVAELFIGNSGLGYSIGYYANFLQMDFVFLNNFVVGIFGVVLTMAMRAVQQRVQYRST